MQWCGWNSLLFLSDGARPILNCSSCQYELISLGYLSFHGHRETPSTGHEGICPVCSGHINQCQIKKERGENREVRWLKMTKCHMLDLVDLWSIPYFIYDHSHVSFAMETGSAWQGRFWKYYSSLIIFGAGCWYLCSSNLLLKVKY